MISFFKSFDPIRLIALLLVLLAIRLPMVWLGFEPLEAELSLFITGERLADGWTMYRDAYDSLEPFTAGFYWLVALCFGKSYLALHIISVLLLLIQALYMNIMLNESNMFNERTSLPGLLYILFGSCFFDMYTVSPTLLSLTFILPILHLMFYNLRVNSRDEYFYLAGLLAGIASLFFVNNIIFLLLLLCYLVIFIKPNLRILLSLLLGFALPITFTVCYFYWKGAHVAMYQNLVIPILSANTATHVITQRSMWLILSPALALLVIGMLFTFSYHRYINYQYNVIKIMGLYVVFSVFSLFFTDAIEPMHFLLLLPALVFFASQYLQNTRGFWFNELPFLVIALAALVICYGTFSSPVQKIMRIPMDKLLVTPSGRYAEIKNKHVLVLGKLSEVYLENKVSTPYYRWELAERPLTKLSNYQSISEVYRNLFAEQPDVIIDRENAMPNLMNTIPSLKDLYEKNEFEDIYIRRKGVKL